MTATGSSFSPTKFDIGNEDFVLDNAVLSSDDRPPLRRPVVLDGQNIAHTAVRKREYADYLGLLVVIRRLIEQGNPVTAFVPLIQKFEGCQKKRNVHNGFLIKMMEDIHLVSTSSCRRLPGTEQSVINYDDLFVLEWAEKNHGLVLSQDRYNDIAMDDKYCQFRDVIQNQRIQCTFTDWTHERPGKPYGYNVRFYRFSESSVKIELQPDNPKWLCFAYESDYNALADKYNSLKIDVPHTLKQIDHILHTYKQEALRIHLAELAPSAGPSTAFQLADNFDDLNLMEQNTPSVPTPMTRPPTLPPATVETEGTDAQCTGLDKATTTSTNHTPAPLPQAKDLCWTGTDQAQCVAPDSSPDTSTHQLIFPLSNTSQIEHESAETAVVYDLLDLSQPQSSTTTAASNAPNIALGKEHLLHCLMENSERIKAQNVCPPPTSTTSTVHDSGQSASGMMEMDYDKYCLVQDSAFCYVLPLQWTGPIQQHKSVVCHQYCQQPLSQSHIHTDLGAPSAATGGGHEGSGLMNELLPCTASGSSSDNRLSPKDTDQDTDTQHPTQAPSGSAQPSPVRAQPNPVPAHVPVAVSQSSSTVPASAASCNTQAVTDQWMPSSVSGGWQAPHPNRDIHSNGSNRAQAHTDRVQMSGDFDTLYEVFDVDLVQIMREQYPAYGVNQLAETLSMML